MVKCRLTFGRLVAAVLLSGAFSLDLFALKVPITQSATVKVEIGKPTILEFPFKIKGVKAMSFVPKFAERETITPGSGSKEVDSALSKAESDADTATKKNDVLGQFLPPPPKNKRLRGKDAKKYQRIEAQRRRPVLIEKGANTITVLGKKFGHFTMVVWGYKEYPIMLDVIVVPKVDVRYLEFVDYSQKKSEQIKFESVPHEKVIVKLMRYLFNEKTPKGYSEMFGSKKYKLSGFDFDEVRLVSGNKYQGEEWVLKNETSRTVNLYGQMFYKDGIYAVAIENNLVKPGESTRVFIVREKRDNAN